MNVKIATALSDLVDATTWLFQVVFNIDLRQVIISAVTWYISAKTWYGDTKFVRWSREYLREHRENLVMMRENWANMLSWLSAYIHPRPEAQFVGFIPQQYETYEEIEDRVRDEVYFNDLYEEGAMFDAPILYMASAARDTSATEADCDSIPNEPIIYLCESLVCPTHGERNRKMVSKEQTPVRCALCGEFVQYDEARGTKDGAVVHNYCAIDEVRSERLADAEASRMNEHDQAVSEIMDEVDSPAADDRRRKMRESLAKLTKKQLVAECGNRGLATKSKTTKAQMIDLILGVTP